MKTDFCGQLSYSSIDNMSAAVACIHVHLHACILDVLTCTIAENVSSLSLLI